MNGRPPELRLVEGAGERRPEAQARGTGEHLPEAPVRGATVIPERVVARLTDQAAREALTRREGMSPARAGLGPPRSSATVHRGTARLAVSVDLTYPVDIAGACGALARDITARVHQLTGLRIEDTTVSVHRLVLKESLRQRRVR